MLAQQAALAPRNPSVKVEYSEAEVRSEAGEKARQRLRARIGCDLLLAQLVKHHPEQLGIKTTLIELSPPTAPVQEPPPPAPTVPAHDPHRKIRMDDVKRYVCDTFNVTRAEIESAQRAHEITYPRMLIMYLVKRHVGLSLLPIGKALGNRDHTTVLSAVRKVALRRLTEAKVDHDLKRIEEYFGWHVASASNPDEAHHADPQPAA